jgi:hypothetical protein
MILVIARVSKFPLLQWVPGNDGVYCVNMKLIPNGNSERKGHGA